MAEPRRAAATAPRFEGGRFLIVEARYYDAIGADLLAGATRKVSLACARELLAVAPPPQPAEPEEEPAPLPPCPRCGGRMRIIDTFERWNQPRAPPQASSPTGMIAS